ncbi:hypothetical protein N7528_009229 [Penicillium herquei]|nr:hypothetical protein N7528_009229 [Penicillium herquei]
MGTRNFQTADDFWNVTIIGLYGIPGCGKSSLLNDLKGGIGSENFVFFDGSQVIASASPGGLNAFQNCNQKANRINRERAIMKIEQVAEDERKAAIVTGHAMLWHEGDESDIDVKKIESRRLGDRKKHRPRYPAAHLKKWRNLEVEKLRRLCRSHSILFSTFCPRQSSSSQLISLFPIFHRHSENLNDDLPEQQIRTLIGPARGNKETALVFDADKTHAPQDSGKLFWQDAPSPLEDLFRGPLKDSYTAFRQAMLLCEEPSTDDQFEEQCEKYRKVNNMYSSLCSLVDCAGFGKRSLKKGLSGTVRVIGGGRLSDGLFMTPKLKAKLVMKLRDLGGCYVWAFGDSPLDLDMLKAANQAVVITGGADTRSSSMDGALEMAIENGSFYPRQAAV